MRFRDKVVLVTGGNSGIGRAAVLGFAGEGASVIAAARRTERTASVVAEVEALQGRAIGVACDVTVAADCESAVAAAIDAFGRLDVLFNNAGVIFREKTVPDTSEAEWDVTMDVNAKGTYLMSRAALPYLTAQRGVIVNNASYFGLVGGRGAAADRAAKGAVVQLTKAMALDHAGDGVRVSAVAAGSVDTPMLRGEMEEMGGVDEVRHLFEEKHPVGRIAGPEEIAAAVLYLASDEASFVTGAILAIDGGMTAG